MRPLEPEEPFGLDAADLGIPPRSRLFNLPPAGLGTDRVEGLLSYLIRLARAHCVSPRRMVKVELTAAAPAIARMQFGGFFLRDAATVDGLGKYATRLSETLGRLTGREDLRLLTLLPLQALLPAVGPGLLAGRPKWCSACLEEMAKNGEVYRPLVWSFALYRVCTQHKLAMQDGCPKCGRTQPPVPRYPDLARCDHCGAALTTEMPAAVATNSLNAWVTTAIEDIVTHLPEFDCVATQGHFVEIVRSLVDRQTDGNQVRFCREVGLASRALKCWLLRDERPSFPQLLTVCHGLGVVPSQFLLNRLPTDGGLCRLPKALLARAERPLLSPAERRRIGAKLGEVVADSADVASVATVARRLGLGKSVLSYWFPDRCRKILVKHRAARSARAGQRLREDRRKVAEAVHTMLLRGEYPGMRRVNLELQNLGASLGRPELMRAYKSHLHNQLGR
jgi:hypothetical protein